MRIIKVVELRLISLLLFICLIGPLGRGAGQPGDDFIKPVKKPLKMELEVVNMRDLDRRTFLIPSETTHDRVTTVMEIRSSKIVVADLLTIRCAKKIQNKYLKLGMWISIPVDPDNPENKKHTVKMLFTNIDIYVDGGSRNRRLPFNIIDPVVLDSYEKKDLPVPGPVVVQFDVTEMEAYALEVKGKYLNQHLQKDPNYVEVPGFYYLVPKENPDWDAIRAEAARARRPRSFKDFVIDGSLLGKWYPIEHMEKTKEATITGTERGVYRLEVYRWPSDDKFHVGF